MKGKTFLFAAATMLLATVVTGCNDEPESAFNPNCYFTVSEKTKVRFSPGNLQYQASTNTWRFATHQWNYIGNGNKKISSSYSGWIDLFGWGTGNNPTQTSTSSSSYSSFTDWGMNSIGDDAPNTWRTLTHDEWEYLFSKRTNAGTLFALGTVNGVHGAIILPDNWSKPDGVAFTPSTSNGLSRQIHNNFIDESGKNNHYLDNQYSSSEWSKMEMAGAVFLPEAWEREGQTIGEMGGNYWSSTLHSKERGFLLGLYSGGICPFSITPPYMGLSVRLVR